MFRYHTQSRTVSIPPYELKIESLSSLDQTIDQLFAYLKETGQENELERLSPYFGTLWPSGVVLAKKIATLESNASQRCLEIGCGLAVPSLILLKKGMNVTATDIHPHVPEFLEKNLSHNALPSLRYENMHGLRDSSEPLKYDFIYGSDILYERYHAESVAQIIERKLSTAGRAWITDPARPYLQDFLAHMTRLGFQHRYEIEKESEKEIFFFEFWKS